MFVFKIHYNFPIYFLILIAAGAEFTGKSGVLKCGIIFYGESEEDGRVVSKTLDVICESLEGFFDWIHEHFEDETE
jgi:hypothetical protein